MFLLYVLIVCCCVNHVLLLEKGDYCLTNDGDTGICELLTQCSQALQDLSKGKLPKNCGTFEGTIPYICCKNDDAKPPIPITSPVTQAPVTKPPTRKPMPTSVESREPYPVTEKPTTSTYVNPPGIGHKARAKCWEYKEYVFEEMFSAVPLPGNNRKTKRDECGHTVVKLIVGGTEAGGKEFPHMALLGYEGAGQKIWGCGGTLISELFVLTAGHCLFSRETRSYVRYVRLGDLDLNSNTDNALPQEIEVERDGIMRHPQYTSTLKYNDIALIKMKNAAKLNPYVRPACLYTKDTVETSKAIATGWGKTDYGGPTSSQLLKVVLDMYTNNQCNESYEIENKLDYGIIDTQLCAGTFDDKSKDTCQGDSGGPLQIYNLDVYCMYNIIGVTSFGKACGVANTPGVYTRVSKYLDWIENTVWN